MKFYVFHYTEAGRLPKVTPEQAAELKKLMEDALAKNPAVTYNGTMVDPNTGIGICDFDAPTAKDVEDVLAAEGAPYDVVVPVEPLTL
ncbi:hypothetical protein ES703_70795 [subsurface metagenome]